MPEPTFDELIAAMKKGAGVLQDADVPFILGGGLAAWARGGPKTEHDVDFMIKEDDVERAVQAFADADYETEKPPEGWLRKAWVDGCLVDLIFHPSGGPITQETIDRAEVMEVVALRIPVATLEDVMSQKLLALTEQIDWAEVRRRTEESPFAKGFFTLVEELGVVDRADVGA